MSTAHSTESAASEGDASAPDALQGRVTIPGEEMDPSLWSPGSTAGSQPSSSPEAQAPPAKKARLLSARPKSRAQKTKTTSKKKAPKKTPGPKKKTSTKKRAAAKSSSKQAKPNLPPNALDSCLDSSCDRDSLQVPESQFSSPARHMNPSSVRVIVMKARIHVVLALTTSAPIHPVRPAPKLNPTPRLTKKNAQYRIDLLTW
ncbi:unnamed protein product [Phytophthora fragariaefolia]|uniref:Unnamed protein product n=1 Tax=Phytophthora fragariaefolia TaxID=1490495 RepID=A0A9W6XMN2_9STRA|nr:unnamed protein product [Phytophthora fragariaefolia]